MTHDSIGLGEDGPTHQPIEHLASLRAIPNLHVFRPSDAIETMECWQLALNATSTPSIIALSRQNLPLVRLQVAEKNLSEYGGYILKSSQKSSVDITIVATGSEVTMALEAQNSLEKENIATTVVSMPCCELFDMQSKSYQESVIDPNSKLIVVEAGVRQSWDKKLSDKDHFIGMDGFGASAPATGLYEHFHITKDAIIEAAKS